MIGHKPWQRQVQLGSTIAWVALAAASCGGDSKVTANGATAGGDPAVACAQNPSAPSCAVPANGNASTILVMVQPPPMPAAPPAAPTTTTPAAAPTFPMFPRGSAAGAPGLGGFPTAPTGAAPGAAGAPATPPPPAMTASAAGAAAPAGAAGAGSNLVGIPDAELDMLRQTCVDEINRYRATLTTMNLTPMKRASAAQEACSDKGAQMDGDSMQAHGAAKAGVCRSVGLFAENTCPGWPVGARSGFATLADALKGCLKSMWDEGEPPVSRAECMQDSAGCFLKHGHYLNMSSTSNLVASCGFYKMKSGAYWMNQDFASR